MNSLRFQDRKSEFTSLEERKQEQLFALSCFQSSHLEAGFPAPIDKVENEIKKLLRELYGDGPWRKMKSNNDIARVLSTFDQGDAMNYILEWFLENKYSEYRCRSEQHNTNSQFDVTILDQDIKICGIELKRAGSSNRISEYLNNHQQLCEDTRSARNYLLVNLFPITDKMDPVRTFDLIDGYGRLSPQIHDFYDRNNSYVATIPAPIFETDSDIEPLKTILDVLETDLKIQR